MSGKGRWRPGDEKYVYSASKPGEAAPLMYAKVTPHGFDVYFGKLGVDAKDETLSTPIFALTLPADGREPWIKALLVCVEPAIGPPFGEWQMAGDAGTRNLMPNTFELRDDEKVPQHNEAAITKVRVPDKRCNALQKLMHQFAFHLFGEKPKQFEWDRTYAILAEMWGKEESHDAKAARMVAVDALFDTIPNNCRKRYDSALEWARGEGAAPTKEKMFEPFRPPWDMYSKWRPTTVLRPPLSEREFALAMFQRALGEAPRSSKEQAEALQGHQFYSLRELALAATVQQIVGQTAVAWEELREVREELEELKKKNSGR